MCLKLGYLPVHNSKGVFRTALLGTLFNKYMTVFKAYILNDTCKDEYLACSYPYPSRFDYAFLTHHFVVVYLALCIKHKYHVSQGT